MLKQEEMQELLEIAMEKNVDFAEIFEENTFSSHYRMMNQEVEESHSSMCYGVGIRLYHKLRCVYAYTNEVSFANVKDTILQLQDALPVLKKEKKPKITLQHIVYETMHPIQKYPSDHDARTKTALMKRASDAAFAYDKRIKKTIVRYQDEQQSVTIANSEGKYIQDERVRTRLAVVAIAEDGTNMHNGQLAPGASMGLEFYEQMPPEEIGKAAARMACVMLHAKECPSGVMDVVIDHGFGGVIFHEACGHALEASSVAKNQSVFANKLGQKIASEVVTAIDDGTIPYAWGSSNIDDEGNFTKRNVLIEHGVLKEYLVDQLHARRMHTTSSGSGRRESYRYEPTSRMTNTYIANGPHTFEEIIENTKYGLYAKTLGGGSVDPSTGDFNFAVLEGYLIEDGKIKEPLKGATLIGNGAKTLLQIDMVANNVKREQGMCGASSGSIPVDVGQPTIRVRNLLVGGRNGGDA